MDKKILEEQKAKLILELRLEKKMLEDKMKSFDEVLKLNDSEYFKEIIVDRQFDTFSKLTTIDYKLKLLELM